MGTRAASGDGDQAFVAWASSRVARLHRVAYLMCGDWHAAEDVVQDALSGCAVHWRRIERMDNPDAYVHRALVNAVRQQGRRGSGREQPRDYLPEAAVSDGADHRAQRDELLILLRGLPVRQRAAIVLRYFEQLSEAETADALGCSRGTVKSQTSRALARLRSAIASQELSC